ncbi:uroporphyrinogen decarboxylase [Methylocystis heyeri]|uniref:Uroporphyrinogen decarboxylase n=1 Tax=Methylocystis heyeri TaxID=391905 RepID=A0A6B8KHH5_9HYPH|nr:uroporphyrinogen decarboxylase [Methylocystis heyeri]QGM47082.1 uroporphyrinogen decarboxylase [Methylocystis heyeri]
MNEQKPLLSVLSGNKTPVPPLWLMRQAGRYLPEYRELRSKAKSFLDFCYSPAAAAEVTLQPIRRFGFDAAILFSDILVVPDALGQKVSFETGEGPKLEPIELPEQLSRLQQSIDLARLDPVFETIDRVKGALPRETAFIGFCGAPWTVASYMIAGRGTPDQAPARLFAYRHPEAFERLIGLLADASAAYLLRQIEAGVEAVQIFDSWAGVLPPAEFRKWVFAPLRRMVLTIKKERPQTPIIAFVRGAGTHLVELIDGLGADAYGLETAEDPVWAARLGAGRTALQGNLDPLALLAGGEALDRGVDDILAAFSDCAHIFNLGHGILPQTPIENVERLVARVRSSENRFS